MIQGSMVEVLRGLLAGAVVLGILVLLHEWGHFVAAKLCGVRVDVFSIGFGPRLWGVKRGDTDYRLSALPLGGYVRMAGDNPVEERTGADYEFLSRPRWQRFIIAVAGPITNIVLTFLIFWGIFTFVGKPAETDLLQPADVVAVPSSAIPGTGIQTGDRIVKVNGVSTPSWESVYTQVEKASPNSTLSVVVSRAGVEQTFSIPLSHATSATDSGLGFPPVAPVTDEVGPGTPAEKAGMKEGDRIVSIDATKVVAWQQLVERVRNSDGRSLHFVVQRDGKEVALDIAPIHQMAPPDGQMMWQIGVLPKTDETYEHQGIIEAATDGFSETVALGKLIGSIFTGLFRGRVSVRDLAGPIGIARMSGQAAKRGPMTCFAGSPTSASTLVCSTCSRSRFSTAATFSC